MRGVPKKGGWRRRSELASSRRSPEQERRRGSRSWNCLLLLFVVVEESLLWGNALGVSCISWLSDPSCRVLHMNPPRQVELREIYAGNLECRELRQYLGDESQLIESRSNSHHMIIFLITTLLDIVNIATSSHPRPSTIDFASTQGPQLADPLISTPRSRTRMPTIHAFPDDETSTSALLLRLNLLEDLLSLPSSNLPTDPASTATHDQSHELTSAPPRPGQDVISRTEALERQLADVIRDSGHESLRRFVDRCESLITGPFSSALVSARQSREKNRTRH